MGQVVSHNNQFIIRHNKDDISVMEEITELQSYKRIAVSQFNAFLTAKEDDVEKEFPMEHLQQMTHRIIRQWRIHQHMIIPMLQFQIGSTPLAIHSYNVGSVACLIGLALDLPEENLIDLGTAAMGHDIGKSFISENIINKDGKLAPVEYFTMTQHPRIGEIFLKTHYPQFNKDITDAILMHHEKPDGSGYYGYTAKDIPKYARIIQVADIFCAIVEERSYHPPRTCHESIEILKNTYSADQVLVALLDERVNNMPKSVGLWYADNNK